MAPNMGGGVMNGFAEHLTANCGVFNNPAQSGYFLLIQLTLGTNIIFLMILFFSL